jgi:hypothetical protein
MVSDGATYEPVANGVVSSGVSAEAVLLAVKVSADVRQLQLAMQKQIETFVARLQPPAYSDGELIKANFVGIDAQGYRVLFPDVHALANIRLQENSSQYSSLALVRKGSQSVV